MCTRQDPALLEDIAEDPIARDIDQTVHAGDRRDDEWCGPNLIMVVHSVHPA